MKKTLALMLAMSGTVGTAAALPLTHDNIVRYYAGKRGFDPLFVHAVIQRESAHNPRICSHAKACGLMQLMPATAKWLGVNDVFNPSQNVEGGTRFLRQLVTSFKGNHVYALQAYNWGPGNMRKYLRGAKRMPDETRKYVPAIARFYRQYGGKGNYFNGGIVADEVYRDESSVVYFGDSIAHGYRQMAGGVGRTQPGRSPSAVLASISSYKGDLSGKTVVLSSGVSNNPGEISLVGRQVAALKVKGATVILVGVSKTYNKNGYKGSDLNKALAKIAKQSGAYFAGGFNSSDGVHPASYKKMPDGSPVQKHIPQKTAGKSKKRQENPNTRKIHEALNSDKICPKPKLPEQFARAGSAATTAAATAGAMPPGAGRTVFDPSKVAQWAQSIANAKKQIDIMRGQYDALTKGMAGLELLTDMYTLAGYELPDPHKQPAMIKTWGASFDNNLYQQLSEMKAAETGVYAGEHFKGLANKQAQMINHSYVEAEIAWTGVNCSLNNLDALVKAAGKTQTWKQAKDVHNAIEVENAVLTANAAKLKANILSMQSNYQGFKAQAAQEYTAFIKYQNQNRKASS
ncbi:MAG: transglycosylase SLT domain-containing protein [Neisseria animaloris]|nr:transglycosylase SLT domain-containing protein [Neisseria animaloris]